MDSHYHDDVVYAEAGGFLEIAPGALAQTEAIKPNSGWLAGMWSGPGGRAIHGSTFCGLELQPTTSDRFYCDLWPGGCAGTQLRGQWFGECGTVFEATGHVQGDPFGFRARSVE